MALTYKGNCAWEPVGNPEIRNPPNELPIATEPWIGRQDQAAAFRTAHTVGSLYKNGYILDNTVRDNQPFPGVGSCDLQYALPPDFNKFLGVNSTAGKVTTKSAKVTASGIVKKKDGTEETKVNAERSVSYEAPQTTYTYFASTLPGGARYIRCGITTQPRILRSVIKATGAVDGLEIIFAGSTAPAALVSALSMANVDSVTSHESRPIPGTPWYDCTDVVTRELQGDT